MNHITTRHLKSPLFAAVMGHVQQGHSVTVAAHRKPIAGIGPLVATASMPAIPGVIWRGSRKIGVREPAVLVGKGTSSSDLLLAQRGECG